MRYCPSSGQVSPSFFAVDRSRHLSQDGRRRSAKGGRLAVSRSHRSPCRSGGGTCTIDDASVDVVLCVGALEHMLNRDQVVRQVSRVLKRGGVFILLAPNGRYCWYTLLAPFLGCSTRHLSTDRFLDRRDAIRLLQFAGLRLTGWDFWTFIPKSDMPRWTCIILEVLDRVGRICRLGACRGGLILTATRGV
jgi:SAM-dependent methyltransferase